MSDVPRIHVRRLLSLTILMVAGLCGCSSETPPAPSDETNATRTDAAGPTGPHADPVLDADLQEIFGVLRRNETGSARVRLKNYEKINGVTAPSLFLFGLTYHRERLYARALPYFDRALEAEPDYATVHYFRGWCLYYMGEPDRAAASFRAHLRYDPDGADAYFGLAVIALDDGRLDESQESLDQAMVLFAAKPNSDREVAKCRTRLADIHVARGDFEAARAQLGLATTLYPNHYEAHYKLSQVLTRLGDTDGAAIARANFEAAQRRLPPGARTP